MTIKTSYLTLLGFHVNSAIDSGNYGYITLDDVRNNIEAGSIFEFLENEIKADTGLWSEENKAAVIEHWQSLNNATIAESDFHVSNNGLNLTWQASLLKTEKDMSQERLYSTVYYCKL